MHLDKPPISELRLQRLHRWMLLWLQGFIAFLHAAGSFAPLSEQAGVAAHRWLDRIEHLAVDVITIRAARRLRRQNRPVHLAYRRNDKQVRRAIIGAAMRRALRPTNVWDRIAALSQPIDTLVARLLKRLPCGLTRRRPIIARPDLEAAALAIALECSRFPDDTS